MTARWEQARLAAALLVAWVGFAAPEHLTGDGRWFLPSVEFFAFGVLALLLPGRWWVRAALAGGAAAWVLTVTAHRVIERVYFRQPAVVEDWRLALNLFHYVESATSPTVWGPAVGGLAALACFIAALVEVARALRPQASARLRALWLLGLALVLNLEVATWPSLGWLSPRDRVVACGFVALQRNYRASVASLAQFRAAGDATVDRRYEALLRRRLTWRPNVTLLMIEAYGEVLYEPGFSDFMRGLGARVEERLAAAGYGLRTALSEAPVYGGGSWLSMATMQVGIRIERPSQYALLERVGTRVPGLTRFFEAQGYRTYGLFPGNASRKGLDRYDLYGRHVVVEGPELEFRGRQQVWGAAPDQYSWAFFRERYLADAPSPRFVTYMSVSTHYSWWYLAPFVADWRTLSDLDETNDVPAGGWEPLPLPSGPGPYEAPYAQCIEYEWRVLLDVIAAEASDDAVFVIIGDHQPYLGKGTMRKSFRTPVHVVTRHRPTLEAFEAAGFREGFFVALPEQSSLWHEGLLSLIATRLLIADGQPDAAAEFLPRGVALSGLRAVAPGR